MEFAIDTLIITQARMGSTRLPGKVMLKIAGEELLKIHLDRLNLSRMKDKVVVATTTNHSDDLIESEVKKWGYDVRRGSETDVLDRYYQVAKEYQPKWVVRVTSDCPLIDPNVIDAVIAMAKMQNIDYCANIFEEQFPDGQDVEVFKFSCLEEAWKNAQLTSDREHVTPYLRNNTNLKGGSLFSGLSVESVNDYSSVRMTVDEQNDLEIVEKIVLVLGTDKSWMEYTNYIAKHNLQEINAHILRNEGYLKSLKND